MNSWQSRPWYTGSSPRTRGALLPALLHDLADRIISADAGSTAHGLLPRRCGRDHPRGCGEHRLQLVHVPASFGSSPRMGEHTTTSPNLLQKLRIIPADAGSTRYSMIAQTSDGDHPRG